MGKFFPWRYYVSLVVPKLMNWLGYNPPARTCTQSASYHVPCHFALIWLFYLYLPPHKILYFHYVFSNLYRYIMIGW